MKETIKPATIAADEIREPPFVNEEYGDTMWDPMLKEMEDELANAFRKPGNQIAEAGDDNIISLSN